MSEASVITLIDTVEILPTTAFIFLRLPDFEASPHLGTGKP